MLTFYDWLEKLNENERRAVAPALLNGYDLELLSQLEQIANGIPDPQIRAKFKTMLTCPLVDSTGGCRYPAEYVLSALENNGIHNRVDVEQAVQYVFGKMRQPNVDPGEDDGNIFVGFDPTKPDSVEIFRASFLSLVNVAVKNIKKEKITSLPNVEQRRAGTVSIGQGGKKEGGPASGISPDEILARPSTDASRKPASVIKPTPSSGTV